jgi:hypothetical protein
MKTQSPDTSLEAEQVLIGMVRKAPVSKRFAFVQSWAASLLEASSQYMQQLYPQASDGEARLLFIERQYGKDLTDELRRALHVHSVHAAVTPNYWQALRSLAQIFENLDIPYHKKTTDMSTFSQLPCLYCSLTMGPSQAALSPVSRRACCQRRAIPRVLAHRCSKARSRSGPCTLSMP